MFIKMCIVQITRQGPELIGSCLNLPGDLGSASRGSGSAKFRFERSNFVFNNRSCNFATM